MLQSEPSKCLGILAHGLEEGSNSEKLQPNQMVIMSYKPHCIFKAKVTPFIHAMYVDFTCNDRNNYENLINTFVANDSCFDEDVITYIYEYAVYSGNIQDREIFKYNYDSDLEKYEDLDISIIPEIELKTYDSRFQFGVAEIPFQMHESIDVDQLSQALSSRSLVETKSILTSKFEGDSETKLSKEIQGYNFIWVTACRFIDPEKIRDEKRIGVPIIIFILYSIYQIINERHKSVIEPGYLAAIANLKRLVIEKIHNLIKKVEFSHRKQYYTQKFIEIINDYFTSIWRLDNRNHGYSFDAINMFLELLLENSVKDNDKKLISNCIKAYRCILLVRDRLEEINPYISFDRELREDIADHAEFISILLKCEFDVGYIKYMSIEYNKNFVLKYYEFDPDSPYDEYHKWYFIYVNNLAKPYIQAIMSRLRTAYFALDYQYNFPDTPKINFTMDDAPFYQIMRDYIDFISYLMDQIEDQQQWVKKVINSDPSIEIDENTRKEVEGIDFITPNIKYSEIDIFSDKLIFDPNRIVTMNDVIDKFLEIQIIIKRIHLEAFLASFAESS